MKKVESPSARPIRESYEGPIRLALAAVVLLCLGVSWNFGDAVWAYVAALVAAGLGLLATVRPGLLFRRRIVPVTADTLIVSMVLADTGGAASVFFPLYFPAVLSLVNVSGDPEGRVRARAQSAGAALVLIGGYLLATLAAGGWESSGLSQFALRMAILVLFCASALLVGSEVHALRTRAAGLSAAVAQERDRAGRVAAQAGAMTPVLEALNIESALGYTAEAACAVAGAPYGHVASLRGNTHRTVMRGEADACPSWWHPSVQRLVLWSCREGGAVRLDGGVHGMEGFVAVPVGSPDEEKWGAIVVGGGRVGAEEERELLRLAAEVRPALERRPDAAGGTDPSSGLPNASSLARVLRRELSAGVAPAVLAVGLGDAASSSAEDLLGRLGKRLGCRGLRAFRYAEDTIIVLAQVSEEAQAAGKARSLMRVLDEESKGLIGTGVETAVGFARPGTQAENPDTLVATALLALEEARGEAGGIAGAVVGARETSESGPAEPDQPSVRGLVRAMVARDPYLAGHSAGVSRVAGSIGRALSLPQDELDALEIGALLHDVGKIGIPDQILHKPGRLTDEEYAVIKRHPTVGAEIVAPIPELAVALPAIRHHHERFDGLGYPDGLRAEDIPLIARVAAVADAFDSMTRERPYGSRKPVGVALEEIMRQAGAQFDPTVAKALYQAILGPDAPRADDLAM
ncbi:HD domain-containing protein [Rubrobacter tropicus]|uniref:HD domain-containing protein n=1 Tax=Rubrobacter tropicus TaxID=2653851 RepID=A0A6G8QDM9_9ACTN|nr:HD-GYP domain-containing protein [Rubrobacter tropicus]QIN84357.1 HD domain-containing protein [Rubrobacter tropicus]